MDNHRTAKSAKRSKNDAVDELNRRKTSRYFTRCHTLSTDTGRSLERRSSEGTRYSISGGSRASQRSSAAIFFVSLRIQ